MLVRENSHTELQEDKHWTFYCLLHGFVSFFLCVCVRAWVLEAKYLENG